MTSIIITGATGSIGAYTTLILKEQGYDVIAVGRRKSDNDFFKNYGIPYLSIDIRYKEQLRNLPSNPFAVIHLAGAMPGSMEGYYPQEYIDSIIKGTFNVLEYCRTNNVNRILFSHSRSDTFHLMGTKRPIPSDINRSFPPTGDHSIYAICKNAAVDLIEHYYYQYGLKRFIFRLPTIYCWNPNHYYYVNGVKTKIAYWYLIEQAMKSEQIEIWGDPNRTKEIFYIKDLVEIFRLALIANDEGGIFNVGSGIGVTLEEQINGIIEVFSPEGKKSDIVYRPDKPDAHQFIHDISKTKKTLGFEPKYDYISLLRDIKAEMELNRFSLLWGK